MIDKILCEKESATNYEQLSEERKLKYQEFYKETACSSENYIISVDVASPDNKDYSCVIRYNYDKQGNLAIDKVETF